MLQADIPAYVERVILRCLARRPEDRFPDANSLEEALAACAAAVEWTQADAVRWWEKNQSTADSLESRMPASVPGGF